MRRASAILAELGGAAILVCAALIGLDILIRAVAGAAPFRSFEISTYVFAVVTAIGFTHALYERMHIRIEPVYERFPPRWRAALDLLNLAFLLACAAALAWQGVLVAYDSYEVRAVSKTTLQLPLVFPQGLWAAALLWFALACATLFTMNLLRWLRRDHSHIEAAVGVGRGNET